VNAQTDSQKRIYCGQILEGTQKKIRHTKFLKHICGNLIHSGEKIKQPSVHLQEAKQPQCISSMEKALGADV
jgi:hypothetical protein